MRWFNWGNTAVVGSSLGVEVGEAEAAVVPDQEQPDAGSQDRETAEYPQGPVYRDLLPQPVEVAVETRQHEPPQAS